MDLNKTLKALNRLDWFLAGGTIAVGLYLQNWWVVGSGCIGLAAAWYRPAERIKARMEKKFLRKKAATSDAKSVQAEDAFYAQVLGQEPAADLVAKAAPTAGDFSAALQSGQFSLNPSRHSVLRYQHFNLAPAAEQRTWA